jgi:hypothetical protein
MTQADQNQEIDGNLKQTKRQTFIFRLALIFVLLIVLASVYCICFYSPPLAISPMTTRITGPLTPDGQIDFFRYVETTYYSNPQIKTDDNGFRIFVRTFGNVLESAKAGQYYIEQKYQKLGLDVNIPPTKIFPESPLEIIYNHNTGRTKTNSFNDYKPLMKAWKLEEFPELTDWIKSVDEPLDEIAEMIRKPLFVCPLLNLGHVEGNPPPALLLSLMEYHDFHTIAYLYAARANYRIAKGDIDGAVNDTITIYQLGQHLAKDVNSLDVALIAISIKAIAHNIQLAANPNYPPTKEQIQRLLDAINQLPPRADTTAFFEFSRFVVLDATQLTIRSGNFLVIGADMDKFVPNFSWCNKNMIFYRVNEAFDVAVGKRSGNIHEYYARLYDNATFAKRWLTSSGRGIIIADYIVPLLMPSFDTVKEKIKRDDSFFNLKRLTLAIHMYKAEHGEFPNANWIEKIKPYLGDNFEKYLHSPNYQNNEKDKTNYALILYDKLPKNKNTLQLIELNRLVPFDQATYTVEEILQEFPTINYLNHERINVALQNGTIYNIPSAGDDDSTTFKKLLGLESE